MRVRRWLSADPRCSSHFEGITLPGRLRLPEATLKTLLTHRRGACRLPLTFRPAVTPSYLLKPG